ncbi:MAG TPA: hypothetical protein VK530_09110 [Candidatus Acidoferrum sp.]|nr:hypothetical protein [Candidatus Acidoferrum sp.]
MPVRINLLAEAQAAEEMRRKDPVKRAIWIGGFVVFLSLLAAVTLQLKISRVRSDTAALHGSWNAIEVKVKQVEEHRRATRVLESKLSALDQFATNRMLWGNVLDALQHTPVEKIQLVHLRTEQSFFVNEGAKPRTNDSGVIPGKPSTVTERIVVNIDGRDFSARQADQVPHFKDSLMKSPYFAGHLHKTNKIQLTSLSAPQLEGSRMFVGFGLQLFLEDKERLLYE